MSKLSPKPDGFKLAPKTIDNSVLSVYASGTGYQLTNTPALLNFGTTDPSLTITQPGTYLLIARVVIDFNVATFAASQVVTLKLRRTNNTAADIANSSTSAPTGSATSSTENFGDFILPPVIYTTRNYDDVIQIFGSIAAVPGSGSIDADEATLIAMRLS